MQQSTRRSFLASTLSIPAVASPSRKYRVAVIGHTGHGAYGHGIDTVWKAFEQVEVVAVADPDADGRAAAVKRIGAKQPYADYREMLRKEKPDLVAIGPRWLDQRKEMVTAVAEAGSHIFMEKPFAMNLEEADILVNAVRKNKVKLQLAHQMRVSAYTVRAKVMVDAGEIGVLQEVRVRGKEDRRAGGEDLMVLGSHLFDMLRYFLGDPKWVVSHVTANGEDITARHVSRPTEPIGPVAGNQIGAMFAFDHGVHGYFASRASDQTDPLRFGAWLYGSKGVLFLPFAIYPEGGLYVLRSASWLPGEKTAWEKIELPRTGTANGLLVADLLRAIERNEKPCCNEEDGRWTIEMIQGVYQGQATGGRVAFPLTARTHPLESSAISR